MAQWWLLSGHYWLPTGGKMVVEGRQRHPLQWHHNGHDGISNHQPHDCLFNRLFRHRSKKTPKLHVTGLCVGNSPVTGEFPTQMASNVENVSIWWCHHGSDWKLMFAIECLIYRAIIGMHSATVTMHVPPLCLAWATCKQPMPSATFVWLSWICSKLCGNHEVRSGVWISPW